MGGEFISFTVPGPPEGKRRPRTRVFGKRATIYTDPADKRYEAKVRAGAKVAMLEVLPWAGPVVISLRFWLPVPASASGARKRRIMDGDEWFFGNVDVDNGAKACLDGMNKVVFADDRQVMRLVIEKSPTLGAGSVDIVVVQK